MKTLKGNLTKEQTTALVRFMEGVSVEVYVEGTTLSFKQAKGYMVLNIILAEAK